MNRIVLIGNGFDLAHGLQTSYADFINWYWNKFGESLLKNSLTNIVSDDFCSITLKQTQYYSTWYQFWSGNYIQKKITFESWTGLDIINLIKKHPEFFDFEYKSPFFERINKSVETKGWVDIENEYYSLLTDYAIKHYSEENIKNLNKHLKYLQNKLIEYLSSVYPREININLIQTIKQKIYAPIRAIEVSIEAKNVMQEYVDYWKGLSPDDWSRKLYSYGIQKYANTKYIDEINNHINNPEIYTEYPSTFMLPDKIMLLSFNYTRQVQEYWDDEHTNTTINYIHGKLDDPDSVIFGYGDELDDNYKQLQKLNNNECLLNVKSIKYLESDNYRNILEFAESAPYQICIMGHSCGNSDRTLLNTLFEHKNCISIKPYFYLKNNGVDNYLELVQNISRNFTDMKLMRDRVVNKTYCEPLT